jgi:ribosomal protein S13
MKTMPMRGQRTATNKKRKKPAPTPTPKKGY